MWELLKTIVEKLCQPRTRKEKIEDRAKQRLVFLDKALHEYHAAYDAYSTERNSWNYAKWMQATEWLDKISEGIDSEIRVFDTQLYHCIQRYLRGTFDQSRETRWDGGRNIMAVPAKKDGPANDKDDFEPVTEGLRRFMEERMTFGEILNVHSAYKRKRLWFTFKVNLRFAAQPSKRKVAHLNRAEGVIFHVRKHIGPHI